MRREYRRYLLHYRHGMPAIHTLSAYILPVSSAAKQSMRVAGALVFNESNILLDDGRIPAKL